MTEPAERREREFVAVWVTPNPFVCPNDPPCEHPGLIHDIHDPDDGRPACCAEGCDCGKGARLP